MTSVLETVRYFARRFRPRGVVLVGRHLPLRAALPEGVSFRHFPTVEDAERESVELAGALVVGLDVAHAVAGAAYLARASDRARAVLAWDKTIRYVGPNGGWKADRKAANFAPFGLDLGFSLYDPKLPTSMPAVPDLRVRPIITVFNEADIIEACVGKLLEQGCEPIIIDNWSTDGTTEILQAMAAAGKIELLKFPEDGPSKDFDLSAQLAQKEQIAERNPACWLVHQDADELRYGTFPDLTLKQNFQLVEAYGCNAVDYTVINFRPVDNGWARGKDPEHAFPYFEFGEGRDNYTCQIKAWWSKGQRVSLSEQAGHEVRFPGRAVFPYKFLLKHYPLRSDEHARTKLRKERLPRFAAHERKIGWHTHYDRLVERDTFLRKPEELIRFDKHGTGGIGASLVTGLQPSAPDGEDAEPMAIPLTRVWLPFKACIVIDLPNDAGDAFSRSFVYEELASVLKGSFESVHVLAVSPEAEAFARKLGMTCELLDQAEFTEYGGSPASRSIALAARLKQIDPPYLIGIEAGGALGAACSLKSQGLAFADTHIAVVMAGGERRRLLDLGFDLHQPVHFETDHFEWLSVSRADQCLSPSEAISDPWLERGVDPARLTVLPPRQTRREPVPATPTRIDQIVVLGPQGGIDFNAFNGAMKAIGDVSPGFPITFVGPFGIAFGEHSGGLLIRGAKDISVTLNLAAYTGREALVERLKSSRSLVVLPRSGGWERIAAHWLTARGVPCVMVADDRSLVEEVSSPLLTTVPSTRDALKNGMLDVLRLGFSPQPAAPFAGDGDLSNWENWASGLYGRRITMRHLETRKRGRPKGRIREPLVTIAIPHFERAHHLMECIEGFQNQTYKNIEIIVVDDGSSKPETLMQLRTVAKVLEEAGGRLVVQKNAYLGAARNTAFAHAKGEFVLFFDDDDYPFPDLVKKLVTAAMAREADVISMNINFWESGELPASFDAVKCSSSFIGACLPLAYWRNPFGSAAVMVRRSAFEKLGGYTTDYGVGWEDYEFATRSVIEGLVYENIPEVLYLYRVNTQGMAATAPTVANGRRLWRLLEEYTDRPEMKSVLRATFFERVWQEDKTNKWAWLHTLGDRTPLYHRLSRTPFNSTQAYEELERIASAERQPELAKRLRRSLIEGEWLQFVREVPARKPASPVDPERVRESALMMHQLGASDSAIELLERTLEETTSEPRRLLLTLAYLQCLAGRPDQTLDYAARVVAKQPDDPEAMYAIYLASQSLGDASMRDVAEQALYASIKRSYLARHPELEQRFANERPHDLLEYWALHGAERGEMLVEFVAFPDGLSERLRAANRDWKPVMPVAIEFLVERDGYGQWIPDEQGLMLHPPGDVGSPSVARLRLEGHPLTSGVGASLQIADTRAEPIEAAIFLEGGQGDIPLDTIFSALRAERTPLGLQVAMPWALMPRDGSVMDIRAPVDPQVALRSLVIATRTAREAQNNWHGAAYIRRLRVRSSG